MKKLWEKNVWPLSSRGGRVFFAASLKTPIFYCSTSLACLSVCTAPSCSSGSVQRDPTSADLQIMSTGIDSYHVGVQYSLNILGGGTLSCFCFALLLNFELKLKVFVMTRAVSVYTAVCSKPGSLLKGWLEYDSHV